MSTRSAHVIRILALMVLCCSLAWGQSVKLNTEQYKLIHRRVVGAVIAGEKQGALRALQEYTEKHPDDPENWYCLALCHAQLGASAAALDCAKKAVQLGLPPERFVVGPRELLRPLTARREFQEFIAHRWRNPVHGPMLGRVTDTAASFWVRTGEDADVRVIVGRGEHLDDPVETSTARTRWGEDYTAVVSVAGLEPDTVYGYRAVVNGAFEQGPPHVFRTFPTALQPAKFRVGFGGGAGYTPVNERVWDTILTFSPAAFLMLGDNVYIDAPTMPALQDYCYYRRQSRPEWRRFAGSTCLYAIYDDHDFGDNDCWGGPNVSLPTWKRPVWRRFQNNWVNPAYGGGHNQPGCWFDARIADVDFIFLDCRYYRTKPKSPKPSMLGAAQKAWFFDRLGKAGGTFKVIASSVPWAFGTKPGSPDTWEGYAGEREEIFSFIERNRIGGVILLSADRHRSDVWRIDRDSSYALYDFESSKLTNEHTHEEMEGALFSYNEKPSFGLLDFDTNLADPEVKYSIVNIDGETVNEHIVKRSELQAP